MRTKFRHRRVVCIFVVKSIGICLLFLATFKLSTRLLDLSNEDVDGLHSLPLQSSVMGSVFYFWCSNNQYSRLFEFRHYLSVLSAIRHLRPDNIFFYYETEPRVDSQVYNTWFSEISDQYPFFNKRQIPMKFCRPYKATGTDSTTFVPDIKLVAEMIASGGGGIYVDENVIFIRPAAGTFRRHDSIEVVDINNVTIVRSFKTAIDYNLLARNGTEKTVRFEMHRIMQLSPAEKLQTVTGNAIMFSDGNSSHSPQLSASVFEGAMMLVGCSFYPKDIWELSGPTGRLLRTVAYGKPRVSQPKTSYDELVPNIAHQVWIGGGKMNFMFYLSSLSLLNVAKVDTLFIHCDKPPRGYYWNLIKKDHRLKIVYRAVGFGVYGNNISSRSHLSDVWRVDLMIRYGGIYADTDVIFLHPLSRQLRGYDAVATNDILSNSYTPFPDIINFGVTIGKRNANFWRLFQQSMKFFMDHDWTWNGLRQPYKIKERHPELLLVDPHLQVICFDNKCHPTWWSQYKIHYINHLTLRGRYDWRKDTVAVHWTDPTPLEFAGYCNLLSSTGTFADIGRMVLSKSGMLQYFTDMVPELKNENS